MVEKLSNVSSALGLAGAYTRFSYGGERYEKKEDGEVFGE